MKLFKITLGIVLMLFISGCSFAPDSDIAIVTGSDNTINGFFPVVDLRDVLLNAGVLFNRPSLGTPFLSNEEIDNIICTNNKTVIIQEFSLESLAYESPNISSLGIPITNPAENLNRQSNRTSNISFYLLPTIIDDGTLIYSDTGVGTQQTVAEIIDRIGAIVLKRNECYNFRVINGDNQARDIFSIFEWGEVDDLIADPKYGNQIKIFIDGE